MKSKKLDIIVDLQFGSTGKGALAGYLATKGDYDCVMTANMPNAGHSYIDANGNKMIFKALPNSLVGPNVDKVMIGPGAVVDPDRLISELNTAEQFGYDQFEVYIHAHAVVLRPDHKRLESSYSRIGSTQQGSAAAIINKLHRDPTDSPLWEEWDGFHPRVKVVSPQIYQGLLISSKSILAEGSQGYSLGLNAGFWPYCTSRDCTVSAFLSFLGVPHSYLRYVYGTARTYPIRVGGNSGPCYPDQAEITWEDLKTDPEYTTVTNRVRRVFTFSHDQLKEAVWMNSPDFIFLNFCNYLEDKAEAFDLVGEINRELERPIVRFLGHGPTVNDITEIHY
jgi:adenylosuccinate synthase